MSSASSSWSGQSQEGLYVALNASLTTHIKGLVS